MKQQIKGFKSEMALSEAFNASVTIKEKMQYHDWNMWEVRELQGLFGVPDHLLVLWKQTQGGHRILRTLSFELKRENWRRALVQAYRYLAFSEYSFVVMDQAYVHRALSGISEFKRANVGLISISSTGSIIWHFLPGFRRPYMDSARLFLKNAIQSHLFNAPIRQEGPQIKWN